MSPLLVLALPLLASPVLSEESKGAPARFQRVSAQAAEGSSYRDVSDLTGEMKALARQNEGATDGARSAAELNARAQRARALCEQTAAAPRPVLPPVRSQGSVGWCYAYAAADLLSARLGKPVSATDVAMLFNQSFFVHSLALHLGVPMTAVVGGDSRLALGAALKRGVCLEEDVRSDLQEFTSDHVKFYRELEDASRRTAVAGGLAAARASADGTIMYESPPESAGQACTTGFRPGGPVDAEANALCLRLYDKARRLFPRLTRGALFDALRLSAPASTLLRLDEASCRRVPVPGPPKIVHLEVSQATAPSAFEEILLQLRRENPVAIGYRADVLEDFETSAGRADHESVLIAARWGKTKQACELLLRNSWGSEWPCRPGQHDGFYECEPGVGVWIPAEMLMRAVRDADYLQ